MLFGRLPSWSPSKKATKIIDVKGYIVIADDGLLVVLDHHPLIPTLS